MKFKRRIYVTLDNNSDGSENMLAWSSLDSADEGRVAVYELVDEFDSRQIVEVRRKGTRRWFKP